MGAESLIELWIRLCVAQPGGGAAVVRSRASPTMLSGLWSLLPAYLTNRINQSIAVSLKPALHQETRHEFERNRLVVEQTV